ncbi:MAG TPA: polysaccharide deacetylase family protein, partial [Acidimicrobiales bacterium]|nr:polysaccharide deacetylase family protein [Acidimicrobiales bacterium]
MRRFVWHTVMLALLWSMATIPVARATAGISVVWDAPGQTSLPGDPVVALTFDDGPDPTYTPQILDILGRYQVPATFFVVGRQGSKYPQLLQAEAADGDAVGNHTWDHVNLTTTPVDSYRHEVDDVSDLIEAQTGSRPVCLRAPGGRVDDLVVHQVADRGLATVGWSVDPQDWARPSADAIVSRVLNAARAGSIIELHDGGGDRSQTIAAL